MLDISWAAVNDDWWVGDAYPLLFTVTRGEGSAVWLCRVTECGTGIPVAVFTTTDRDQAFVAAGRKLADYLQRLLLLQARIKQAE
jgi:hypothetical protein